MELTVQPVEPAIHPQAERTRGPAAQPPDRVGSGRGPPSDTAVVSMTQVGLVGRSMLDLAPPSGPAGAPPGAEAARRVDRVLKPYGVTMLPNEAAQEARRAADEAADAARIAAASRHIGAEAPRAVATVEAAKVEPDAQNASGPQSVAPGVRLALASVAHPITADEEKPGDAPADYAVATSSGPAG